MYEYNADIYRVIDGDTVKAKIDLGFNVFHDITIRLMGINTPELKAKTVPEAVNDRAVLATKRLSQLVLGKSCILKTFKDKKDKYGRYLADIFSKRDDGIYRNVNTTLLEEGLADFYDP